MAREPGQPWLESLHQLDRRAAKEMMEMVGEARFMRIAKAAAQKPRAPKRPKVDDSPLVRRVLMHWLAQPSLDLDQAAAVVAKAVVDARDWQGRAVVTFAYLKRKLREDLKQVPLEFIDQLRREAEANGLKTRFERPSWLPKNRQLLGTSLGKNLSRMGTHYQRIGFFLRAFEHLIDKKAPIFKYARLYAEVASLLAETEPKG